MWIKLGQQGPNALASPRLTARTPASASLCRPRSRFASDKAVAPKSAGTRYVQACAPVEERPMSACR